MSSTTATLPLVHTAVLCCMLWSVSMSVDQNVSLCFYANPFRLTSRKLVLTHYFDGALFRRLGVVGLGLRLLGLGLVGLWNSGPQSVNLLFVLWCRKVSLWLIDVTWTTTSRFRSGRSTPRGCCRSTRLLSGTVDYCTEPYALYDVFLCFWTF